MQCPKGAVSCLDARSSQQGSSPCAHKFHPPPNAWILKHLPHFTVGCSSCRGRQDKPGLRNASMALVALLWPAPSIRPFPRCRAGKHAAVQPIRCFFMVNSTRHLGSLVRLQGMGLVARPPFRVPCMYVSPAFSEGSAGARQQWARLDRRRLDVLVAVQLAVTKYWHDGGRYYARPETRETLLLAAARPVRFARLLRRQPPAALTEITLLRLEGGDMSVVVTHGSPIASTNQSLGRPHDRSTAAGWRRSFSAVMYRWKRSKHAGIPFR